MTVFVILKKPALINGAFRYSFYANKFGESSGMIYFKDDNDDKFIWVNHKDIASISSCNVINNEPNVGVPES